jgi:uncharacterized SAM-binding protein YcdF (DUF218 family)/lysophospholipase L1-like esterase
MMPSSPESRAAAPPVLPAAAVRRRRWRPSPFVRGLLVGVILVFAVRAVINNTAIADRLVSRLIPTDTTGPADAIVVLGAGIVGPCEPNLNAIRRVLLGVQLWHQQRAGVLLFTGGRPVGKACPVAVVMSRLAGELGVPGEARITEEASRSTHENALLSAPLLRQRGVKRILLVTDRLHMRRAEGAFAAEGFAIERASVPVYASHGDNVSMLSAGFREYVALLYYRHRGWLAGPPRTGRAADQAPARVTPIPVMLTDSVADDRPVVILGASYAGGWKPARLGGHPVVNAGVAGEESWQMLARFDRDVVAHRPRAVILWGFINDIHRAPKDRVDQAVSRARESFVTMIARARAAGIEPIVATELTIRPVDSWSETFGSWVGWALGKESYQAVINRRVLETNAWLRDLARREGLLVLDLHPQLSDADGMRRKGFAKPDGSHIPPAGYDAIAAYAVPLLDAHLKRAPSR